MTEPSGGMAGRIPEAPAFLSALFFGLSIPLCKMLLGGAHPMALSALLYTGSGAVLAVVFLFSRRKTAEASLSLQDAPLLAGAILCGGVLAPLAFTNGLSMTTGSAASLLLNLETPFTVLVAALLFQEEIGAGAWTALGCMLAASLCLSYDPSAPSAAAGWKGPSLLAGACALWGMDNNLTRGISHKDPVAASMVKGLAAGTAVLVLTRVLAVPLPSPGRAAAAMAVGGVCYGASLVLFMRSLRTIGAARTGIIFAAGPFIGALASVLLLGERPGPLPLAGCALMAAGVWILVRESHGHPHRHDPLKHDHRHSHDDHHAHRHDAPLAEGEHAHPHVHQEIVHSHPHHPDIHHRHPH